MAVEAHPRAPPRASLSRAAELVLRRETAGTVAVFVIFIALWQWGPGTLHIPSYIVPTASECWAEFLRMIGRDRLFYHMGITALEVLVGFGLGALLGMVSGYVLGMSTTVEVVLSPYILALQIAPKVAFAPLFIMWFGYNAWPKFVVTVLVVFFPILVNVLQSMKTADRDLVNLARAYSMGRAQIFWKVLFPASMPNLLAGLRIGATLAVIGVTVGELVGGSVGLGYLITYGEGQADSAMVFDAIVLLTVIGILLYWAVAAIEARILHYLPRATT